MAIVEIERGHQRPLGQTDLALQILGRLADPTGLQPGARHLIELLVDDQIRLALLAEQHFLSDASVVRVLVDEALTVAVDQHAGHQLAGRRHGHCALGRIHAGHRRAEGLSHADANAVVERIAQAQRTTSHQRAVALDHLVVVYEPTRRQHHTPTGSYPHVGSGPSGHQTHDRAVGIDHQSRGSHVDLDPGRGGRHRIGQALHQKAAGGVTLLGLVPTRCRGGDAIERIGILAAGVDERVIGRGLDARLGVEAGLERHPLIDQPVVVVDAAVAVEPHFGFVGIGAAGRHQEEEHLLSRVLEPALDLDRRASAEIDQSTRLGRRAPRTPRRFEHQHVGADLGRAERRAGSGRTHADDDDVSFEIPGRDIGYRRRFGRHARWLAKGSVGHERRG